MYVSIILIVFFRGIQWYQTARRLKFVNEGRISGKWTGLFSEFHDAKALDF